MAPSLPPRLWSFLCLAAALCLALPARAESGPGPRLKISSRGPIRPGDRIEFEFTGDMDGIEEFEVLLSTDGGRTYPIRISEELSPATRRLSWRVPRLPGGELRLKVQFNRDGREIEGEESVPLPLIADRGEEDGHDALPQAVEPEGVPLPSRNRGPSRTSGSEAGKGENADRERRDPLTLQRLPSSTMVPVPTFLPRAASGTTPDLCSAPTFVPPRK